MRAEYDVAVFQAMKAVEVTVREAAGLTAKDIGTGPLTDMQSEPVEHQARSAPVCRCNRLLQEIALTPRRQLW